MRRNRVTNRISVVELDNAVSGVNVDWQKILDETNSDLAMATEVPTIMRNSYAPSPAMSHMSHMSHGHKHGHGGAAASRQYQHQPQQPSSSGVRARLVSADDWGGGNTHRRKKDTTSYCSDSGISFSKVAVDSENAIRHDIEEVFNTTRGILSQYREAHLKATSSLSQLDLCREEAELHAEELAIENEELQVQYSGDCQCHY
jgi:hypothetical protein